MATGIFSWHPRDDFHIGANEHQAGAESSNVQSKHVVHYPLNGVNLDFCRYTHRSLGQLDVWINRIMEDYIRPRRVSSKFYLQDTSLERLPQFSYLKAQDYEFGLSLQVANKMLLTLWNDDRLPEYARFYEPTRYGSVIPLASITPWYHCRNLTACEKVHFQALDELVYGLLQRYFLETHSALRVYIKYAEKHGRDPWLNPASGWKKNMLEHSKTMKQSLAMQHLPQLFSGGNQYLVLGLNKPRFLIEPCMIVPRNDNILEYRHNPRLRKIAILRDAKYAGRRTPRRPNSLPPPGTRCSVIWRDLFIMFPRRPLSELDKLSRRRSLSRSHIRAMFREWSPANAPDQYSDEPRPTWGYKITCNNCAKYGHPAAKCPSSCGYCDSKEHKASSCPVQPVNRCKCRPFPQFHTAANCFVRCSRRCGSPYPPGHFKHKNAVLCSHRCCMCGLKGHTGRKCNLQKCRCGESHLTQDCRWKVECPARSCGRYLCTEHCRECGRVRASGEYFVGMTCPKCLQNCDPVAPKVEQPT